MFESKKMLPILIFRIFKNLKIINVFCTENFQFAIRRIHRGTGNKRTKIKN